MNSILSIALIGVLAVSAFSQTRRSITVTSEPKAAVWLDGVLYGRANDQGKFEIASLTAGAHTLRVRLAGYKDSVKALTPAAKGEINIALVKTTDQADLAFQNGEQLAFKDREKSVESFNKAISLRPNFPEAFIGMARVQAEDQDYESALGSITKARKLKPANAEASAVEGRILKEIGEEAKAIVSFKRSITEGKGFQPEAYTGLGLLYKEKAEGCGGSSDLSCEDMNYAESEKYLKTAVKQLGTAPDNIVVMQLLGLIYERQHQNAEAIALYKEFLRLFPDSAEATAVRSFIVQLNKDNSVQ